MQASRKQIKRAIWGHYLAGHRGDKVISEKLKEEFPDGPRVSERTIYRDCKELEARYSPEERSLDKPFQITPDLPSPITKDDLPAIFGVIRGINKRTIQPGELGLTLRAARWIALLRPSMMNADSSWVYVIASLYANRERWSRIEGEAFDTSDLDVLLAYSFWRTESDRRTYRAAVDCGLAPDIYTVASTWLVNLSPLDREQAIQNKKESEERESIRSSLDPGIQEQCESLYERAEQELPAESLEAFRIHFIDLCQTSQSNMGQKEFEAECLTIIEALQSQYQSDDRIPSPVGG